MKKGDFMTIQSLMSNKGSLILASDLAVTMDEYKSYVGIKKVFELKKNMPVGVMINGLVDFEDIPLETLIGEFADEVNEFETIEKIRDKFLRFLSKNTNYTPLEEFLKETIRPFKESLTESIKYEGFENTVNNKTTKNIPKFIKKYQKFDEEFIELIPSNYDKKHFNNKIWEIFAFELTFEGTGIIIAGFDKNHHYPTIFSFNLYCNDSGTLIWEEVESKINCKDPIIRVYAMNEEAYSFITGVSDDFEISIKEYNLSSKRKIIENMQWYLEGKGIEDSSKILNVLKKELEEHSDGLNSHINNFRHETIYHTSELCEYLPRRLLCDFADYLIKLTALKQKISLELETVSSESDILLITKRNNNRWVKFTDEII